MEQEVQQEADHSSGCDALVQADVVGNVGKAGPDGCEQDDHALSACGSLDAEPDNGEDATGQDDEVAEVVSEWHAC